ncbi:MAG: hypothetical protein ACFUZC_04275 [Chthoniobacteraceae bacterium]
MKALTDHVGLESESFLIHREKFKCLVVPWAQRLPVAFLQRLLEISNAGVRIIFTHDLPIAASDASEVPSQLAQLRSHPSLLGDFAGVISYETVFTLSRDEKELWLDLGRVDQVTHVRLDEQALGAKISSPHCYYLGN